MLTQSQRLILLGQQLAPDSPLNNMAFAFTLRGGVDPARMQRAFARLVAACDAMRMVIENGETVFRERIDFTLRVENYRRERDPDQRTRDYIAGAVAVPFRLGEWLFDAVLFLQPEHSVLYLNQHHLITDGWGYAVQLEYLLAVYDGAEPEPLPAFADYIARTVETMGAEKNIAHARKWATAAADYPQPPALLGRVNADRLPAAVRLTRQLSEAETERLRAVLSAPDVRAWTEDLALFNILLTAVFTYVCRISGQHDLVIGAPAHNRLTADDKRTAGLAMELFPLRATLSPDDTLGDALNKIKVSALEFLKNARPGTSSAETGRSFNVLLNFINQSFQDGGRAMATEWLHPGAMEPGHHLRVQVYDFDATGQLTLCFDLNTEVFPEDMHQWVVDGFLDTLWQIVDDRSLPLHTLGATDQAFLAEAEVITDETYPTGVTVLDLIDRTVARVPDKIAIRFREQALTFAELDRLADRLAGELRVRGTERGDVVPLCLDRSVGMMVGLLGIMKAGAAYLPLDPALPNERIRFLAEDARAKVVVGDGATAGRLREMSRLRVVELDVEGGVTGPSSPAPDTSPSHLRQRRTGPALSRGPRPKDLMYVLYTSGSTGTPKGVMNQHNGLVNRLEWARRRFVPDTEPTVIMQKTTFAFDVSVWELFLPLVGGAELVLAKPGGEKDPDYLRELIRQHAITTVHFVPPMLETFLMKPATLPSLRTVICSGEALLPHQANSFNEYFPDVELHNLYGPTEAAIHVTHWPVPKYPIDTVPIGHAVANVPLRIYGPEGQVRPVGVPGELFLGGVQVARGYLNRPELTAEKFVIRDGERWYRTGDLVRWQPDGEIGFLGRLDHQVKLRGFRIELGEIEAGLLAEPNVRQAVVLLKKDGKGEPALAAYLTGTALDPKALRAALAAKLPAYMVPAAYVLLDELPLLPNGKINRKVLPDPSFDVSAAARGDAPRGDFETMLHGIWTEVFQLDAIGREAHFLDLGGHSLTGIRLVNRINGDFSLELPANTVFRFPTIAAQAEEIERTIRELMAAMDKT